MFHNNMKKNNKDENNRMGMQLWPMAAHTQTQSPLLVLDISKNALINTLWGMVCACDIRIAFAAFAFHDPRPLYGCISPSPSPSVGGNRSWRRQAKFPTLPLHSRTAHALTTIWQQSYPSGAITGTAVKPRYGYAPRISNCIKPDIKIPKIVRKTKYCGLKFPKRVLRPTWMTPGHFTIPWNRKLIFIIIYYDNIKKKV